MFTGCKQWVQRPTEDVLSAYTYRRRTLHMTRQTLQLRHIPLADYLAHTRLPPHRVPVYPMLVPLRPYRVSTAVRLSAPRRPWRRSDRPRRRVPPDTAAPPHPNTPQEAHTTCAHAQEKDRVSQRSGEADANTLSPSSSSYLCVMYRQCEWEAPCALSVVGDPDGDLGFFWRCPVSCESAYRLVLLSAHEREEWWRLRGGGGGGHTDDGGDAQTSHRRAASETSASRAAVPLTRELLRQLTDGAWGGVAVSRRRR